MIHDTEQRSPAAVPPEGDRRAAPRRPPGEELSTPDEQDVYRRVLDVLREGGVELLVGGAYAFTRYTGIERSTKDFDIFVRSTEIQRALAALADAGFRTELTFPHWLGKAYWGDTFVDVIFNSGNGVTPIDDDWFTHAPTGEVLGTTVKLMPAEEMLWSKSFVMERERYDGADVIHLIRAGAATLDWDRLVRRFGERWRVLFMNLVLFGFIYPGERTRLPRGLVEGLVGRLQAELDTADAAKVCNGTVVSRQQYLVDVTEWGYQDGRLPPHGNMTAEQVAHWTAAINDTR